MDAPTRDEARAEAVADHHVQQVAGDRGHRVRSEFGESEHIHVVVHPGGNAKAAGQAIPNGVAIPPRQGGRCDRTTGIELNRRGNPDANTPQPRVPLLLDQLLEFPLQAPEHRLRSVLDIDRRPANGEYPPVQICHADAHRHGAHVDAGDEAGLGPKSYAPRRSTPGRRADAVLGDEAGVLQLGDALRDDAAAEPDQLGQLRLRGTALRADGSEDGRHPVGSVPRQRRLLSTLVAPR